MKEDLVRKRVVEGVVFDKMSQRVHEASVPGITADLYYDPNADVIKPRTAQVHLDVLVGHVDLPNHKNPTTDDIDAGCYERIQGGFLLAKEAPREVVRIHLYVDFV